MYRPDPTVKEPLTNLAYDIAQWRADRQFRTPAGVRADLPFMPPLSEADAMKGKMAWVHDELGELHEAVRLLNTKKIPEEFADVAIRILDVIGTMDIPLDLRLLQTNEIPPWGATLSEQIAYLHEFAGKCTNAAAHGDRPAFERAIARLWSVLLSTAEANRVDLLAEVQRKMMINEGRPVRHGKPSAI